MPQLVDERTLLSNMAPNNGNMAAVAELDPRTWQGQLRRNKLSAFVDPYQSLMADPNSTYGTLVPAARDNATGEMRFALPTMLRDIGIGGLDALAGRQVGELTPLATGAISALPFGGAAPPDSLRAGAALRTQRATTPRAAMEAARTASTNSARQAWVWKTPEGKFLVNAGDRPEGAKLVGRAIGDEWFSGPGLMAKAGSKESGAVQAAGKSLPMDEAARMARAKEMGMTTEGYHGSHTIKKWYHDPEIVKQYADSDVPKQVANIEEPISKFDTRTGGLKLMDGLGPHWGTSKAAQQRLETNAGSKFTGTDIPESLSDSYIIPLLAKTEKPFTRQDGTPFSETALQSRLASIAVKLGFPRAHLRRYSSRASAPAQFRNAQKAVRQYLLDQGYDSIPYRNSHEDRGSISWISLDPKNIRSRFAAFDPAKADSADLLASRFGPGVPLSSFASSREDQR